MHTPLPASTPIVAAVKNDQESFAVALLEAGAVRADDEDISGVAGATLSKLASDAHMDILLNAMRRARKA